MNKLFGIGYCFSVAGATPLETCYYMITKGELEQCVYDFGEGVDYIQEWIKPFGMIKVQKMQWEFLRTILVPLKGFRTKQFFYMDEYVLKPDINFKQIKWQKEISFNNISSISEVSRYVKYVKHENRDESYNDNKQNAIVHNENDKNRLSKLLKKL